MKIFLVLVFSFIYLFSSQNAVIQKDILKYYKIYKKDFFVKKGRYYRVAMDKHDKSSTTSESQGYGMMIVAYMSDYNLDAKNIYDGMYRFVKANPSRISKTLMAWKYPAKLSDRDSAFDGDVDIAFSLLVAHKQWGSSGVINYKKEAKTYIDNILKYTIGKDTYLPLLGDWVKQNGKKYNQYTTRSSDFMLVNFRAFYNFTKDSRWLKVIKNTQIAIRNFQNTNTPKTGLISDFLYLDKKRGAFFPVKNNFLEKYDNSYYYNACRVPFRIGLDAILTSNRDSLKIVNKLSSWIKTTTQKNPKNIKAGYTLDGKIIGNYQSGVFISPFLVAAYATKDSVWFKNIYYHIRNLHQNYYEDSLTLLSMMAINGNLWIP